MYFPDLHAHQLVLRKDWLSLLSLLHFLLGFRVAKWTPAMHWAMGPGLFKGDLAWSVLGPGICCSRDEPCPDYRAKTMTCDEHLAY